MTKILITDDDSDYRASIIELLQMEGYTIIDAENGAVALRLIGEESPDLILCDVDMPLLNGIEVLRAVKRDETTRHIPFVTITGRSDNETIAAIKSLGASAYIRKPMVVQELLNLLHTLLNNPNS